MQRMKANASFKLKAGDELPLRRGEEFETDCANAADLEALGMATRLTGMVEALNQALENSHIVPRRNTYRRRDLKVEES